MNLWLSGVFQIVKVFSRPIADKSTDGLKKSNSKGFSGVLKNTGSPRKEAKSRARSEEPTTISS